MVAGAPEGAKGPQVALQAVGLRTALGDTEVLHGIDLRLAPECWTAVVGPNGAGKTTLLKSLAQLLPHHGEVLLLGRPAAQWSRRQRACALAWLGQQEAPGADLLARDVVLLGRLPHRGWLAPPAAADLDAAEHAMRQTQCWDWRERPLGSLSGGERQRVLLARALAVQAPVLLMDEPLANLDAPHQADWMQIVRSLAAHGGTVVSVLHELGIALQADQLVVMRGGRVVHHGASGDAATHAALVDVFQGRIELHRVAGQWVVLPR